MTGKPGSTVDIASAEQAAGGAQLGFAAFGLGLLLDGAPPGAWQAQRLPGPTLEIKIAGASEIEHSWSGPEGIGWQGMIDGAAFVVERGIAGDHRFVHGAPPDRNGSPATGTRAIHHLRSDGSVLQCAPTDRANPAWWRVVLDSVLFTVALLRGYEALHAGAFASPSGAVAITASTGGGKSTLLAAILTRGHALMADDVLVLEPHDSRPPLAHPAPPLMTVPCTSAAWTSQVPPQAILSIDGERWVSVPVHPEPLELKALVVLDRRSDSGGPTHAATLTKIENPLAPLLDSLMSFPRTPERERARFELASTMATGIELWRLTAGLDTPASVLADTLLAGVL